MPAKKNCAWPGCAFKYDPATEGALYTAHLEGHAASAASSGSSGSTSPVTRTMEDFDGMQVDVAVDRLNSLGIAKSDIQRVGISHPNPFGTVVGQSPAKGMALTTPVTLYFSNNASTTPPPPPPPSHAGATVPPPPPPPPGGSGSAATPSITPDDVEDVVRMRMLWTEARDYLIRRGATKVNRQFEKSKKADMGRVFDGSLKGLNQVELLVSDGPPDVKMLTVPSSGLIGENFNDVQRKLERVGFTKFETNLVNAGGNPGDLVGLDPAPGASVPEDPTPIVKMEVSTGISNGRKGWRSKPTPAGPTTPTLVEGPEKLGFVRSALRSFSGHSRD